jgi:hypothetical protein
MRHPLMAVTSLGLVLVLGSPAGCLGQTETESDEATQATVSAGIAVADEPAAPPDQAINAGGNVIAVGDGGAVNIESAIALPDPAPDMSDEMLAGPVPDEAISEPEGEGPELMPPDEQPPAAAEPVVGAQPGPVGPVVLAAEQVVPAPESSAAVLAPAAPSGDESVVIAQGPVEFETDAVVWRVVRYRAGAPEESDFVWRPVGFVVALDDPIESVDQESGESALLNPGQAAFLPAYAQVQRAGSSDAFVNYLEIELMAASSAEDAADGDVLYVSQPFVPSMDSGALVLARHQLPTGRVLAVPDTGERNLLVVIQGAVVAHTAEVSEATSLTAGESLVFRGTSEVTPEDAEGASPQDAIILIASMGAG